MDETSLLLPPRSSSNLSTQPDQLCAADCGAGPSRVLEVAAPPRPHGLREIANLSRNSIPVIFSYILQNSIQAASISVVARLGSGQLSVAAFSLMLAFVTG
jgi:hypothetical protein